MCTAWLALLLSSLGIYLMETSQGQCGRFSLSTSRVPGCSMCGLRERGRPACLRGTPLPQRFQFPTRRRQRTAAVRVRPGLLLHRPGDHRRELDGRHRPGARCAKRAGLRLVVGSEIQIEDGAKLVLLVETKPGYERLYRLITDGRRRSEKGEYRITREDVADGMPGMVNRPGFCRHSRAVS